MAGERGQRDLTALKVGAAVLIGLAALIYGLIWGQDLLRRGYNLRQIAVFESGFGLSTGDPVLVAGVKKGQVLDITLTPDNRVAVEMRMHDDVVLDSMSLFTIESEGIIGARYVNVTARQGGRPLAPGDTLYGVNAASLSDVFRNVQVLMGRITELTTAVQDIITNEETRARVAQTFDNFNHTVNLLNSVVADNQELVGRSLEDLSEMVRNVTDVLSENKDDLKAALNSIEHAGNELAKATTTIDSLSGSLVTLTERLAAGEGTFWRLTESDSLYVQFATTLTHLDSLITDIKNNPHKYFMIKIF